MDPTNERRVFELLVKHSSDKANSQYFLLSPKVSQAKETSRVDNLSPLAFAQSEIQSENQTVIRLQRRCQHQKSGMERFQVHRTSTRSGH